jgi:hypothetical protein
MKFYSDIAATLGVWNGSKMLTFKGGVYETDDPREIALLISAGYRHDKEVEAECQSQSEKTATSTSKEQTNTSAAASTPISGEKQTTAPRKRRSSKQQEQ